MSTAAFPLNTLGLSHRFMTEHIRPGGFCIDATAGRGRDTLFLCGLVGEHGRVLAMDIQPTAVEATRQLLAAHGCARIRAGGSELPQPHSRLCRAQHSGRCDV